MSITFIKVNLLIINTIMEGTVSQFFYLGPSFYFMQCRKLYIYTRFLR